MIKFNKKLVFIILIGFLIGLILFLPTMAFKSVLLANLRKQTGLDIQIATMDITTGLDLGLKGGLIGLGGKGLSIPVNSQNIECSEYKLIPGFLNLITGKVTVTVYCKLADGFGEFTAFAAGKRFYKNDSFDINVSFDNLNALLIEKQTGGVLGKFTGKVEVTDYNTKKNSFNVDSVNITGVDVSTPYLNLNFLSFPKLDFDDLKLIASMADKKLTIDTLIAGNDNSLVQLKINKSILGLNNQKLPTSGELVGSLRTDANFEEEYLKKNLNLDLIFGKINPSGVRSFKKVVKPGFTWILSPPIDSGTN